MNFLNVWSVYFVKIMVEHYVAPTLMIECMSGVRHWTVNQRQHTNVVLHRWKNVILLKLPVNLHIRSVLFIWNWYFELVSDTSILGLCFRFGEQLGYYCEVWNKGVHGGITGWCWCEHDWSVWCRILLCLSGCWESYCNHQAQWWWAIHLGITSWWFFHCYKRYWWWTTW